MMRTLTLLTLLTTAATAQCAFELVPNGGIPGTNGDVYGMTWWDPDGPGPSDAKIVVAGSFSIAGSVIANNVVTYDPTAGTFAPLGEGLPIFAGEVTARSNGHLLAPAGNDAYEWVPTDASWQSIGATTNGSVAGVLELANGDLFVFGYFSVAGGQPAVGMARFDGNSWSVVGTPTLPWANAGIECAAELPNGDLVVGGFFTAVDGVAANGIARFDGSSWHPLGNGSSGYVYDVFAEPNGDVVAHGNFATTTGTAQIARFDGSGWSELLPSTPTTAGKLVRTDTGDYLVSTPAGFFRTSLGSWSAFGSWNGNYPVATMLLGPHDELFVGGSFATTPTTPASNLARRSAGTWSSFTNGTDAAVLELVAGDDGTFAATGPFTLIEGSPAAGAAWFDGDQWQPRGTGATGSITSLMLRNNGEVVVVAIASTNPPQNRVLRWDGSSLVPVGNAATWSNHYPFAVAPAQNGDVLIGYMQTFLTAGIARWDGNSVSLTPFGTLGFVSDLLELPAGDIVVSGTFALPTGTSYLVRWDGSQLHDIAAGFNGAVLAMDVLDNGDLIVVGQFDQPHRHIARWDGSNWHAVGAGLQGHPSTLAVLPNGDLITNERFGSGSTTPHRVVRWDGLSWTKLATLEEGFAEVAIGTDGTLLIGSVSQTLGGQVAPFLARLEPTCPAASSSIAPGCSGSGGPIELTIDQLPWLGAELRSRTTGIANGSLASTVFGFQHLATPLSAVHPLGLPGCVVGCSDDILLRFDVSQGTLRSQLPVPSAAALIGAVFFHQVVPIEVDASGSIVGLAASNTVELTIGAL